MKKVILISIFCAALSYAAPVPIPPLPQPANYSSDLVLTNVLSTVPVCALKVTAPGGINVSGSSVTLTNNAINVTGSTVTAIISGTINLSISSMSVTGSTVTFTNQSISVSGSSVSITNMPAVSIIGVTGSTVANLTDKYYFFTISSGTSGSITGATSATITVTQAVDTWSFKYRNLINMESTATVTPSITAMPITLFDGDGDSETLGRPAPVTFMLSLPAESTMTYCIMTVR